MSPGSSTGRVVAGRYRIVAPIGSGGHGVVDLAEDLLNGGRRVALKRLEGIVGAGDPEPAADHLRWFRHPRWAEILDEGRLDAHGRFQVVRYVDGTSLDHLELPRPTDEILAFLEDGARVLGALHARGLIHYDVTPGNVLREERADGVVFTLTDGGLANLGPVRGIARGTVMYMAPEIADGAPHDHRVDLYALGLVAFRLATGRDPWVGGAGEVLGGRRREAAPSIRAFRPEADPRLERVIACLLERDPNRRVADSQALLALLAGIGRASAAAPLEGEYYAEAAGGFLLGRDAEVARFRAACRSLLAGPTPTAIPTDDARASIAATASVPLHDNVLIVSGPAGSGGTRLVEEYVAIARAEGVPVLALSGREGAADRRGPLRRLADGIALLTGQTDALAASGRAEARPGREDSGAGEDIRMTERFVALCDRTAERTALVLVVSDFEEFPAPAQESIRVLARHLLSRSEHPDGRAPARILIVVDHGSSEPDGFLLPDAADPRRPVQLLEPLSSDAIRALVTERFQGIDPVPEDIETVRTVTEGLPRLLISILAQARERGDLRREHGLWFWNASQTANYSLDRRISPAAARALAALSPDARLVAEYLAILEVPVPESFLLRLVTPAAIADFAASPLASVSMESQRSRYALRSRTISSWLLDGQTRSNTNSILQSLSSDAPVELQIEAHRLRAALGRRNEAIKDLSQQAAYLTASQRRRALVVASSIAARHPVALKLPVVRRSLATLLLDGPHSDTLGGILETVELASPAPDARTCLVLAEHLIRVRDARRARTLAERALSVLPEVHTRGADLSRTEARVLILRASSLGTFPTSAEQLRANALAEARLLSPKCRREGAHLLAHLALAAARSAAAASKHTKAASLSCRAIRTARRARRFDLVAASCNNMALSLAEMSDFQRCIASLKRSVWIRHSIGDIRGATVATQNLGRFLRRSGSLVAASAAHSRAYGVAVRHGYADVLMAALVSMSEIQDQLGAPGLAYRSLDRASRVPQSAATQTLHEIAHVRHLSLGWTTRPANVQSSRDHESTRSRWAPLTATSRRLTRVLRAVEYGYSSPIGSAGLRELDASEVPPRGDLRLALKVLGLVEREPSQALLDRVRPNHRSPIRQFLAEALGLRATCPPNRASALCEVLSGMATSSLGPSGPIQRLAFTVLLSVLGRSAHSVTAIDDVLVRLARVAEQRGWTLLSSRAFATLAIRGLRRGDTSASGKHISSALIGFSDRSTVEALHVRTRIPSPREFLVFARLAGATAEARGRRSRSVDLIEHLHAFAHRSLLGASVASPDARRENALRAMLSFAARTQASPSLEPLLDSLNSFARDITGAERSCIVLVDDDATSEARIASSATGPNADERPSVISHTILRRVLRERKPLLLHDIYGDSDLVQRPSVVAMSLRSVLCVPLVRGASLYGAMYADNSVGAGSFDQTDLDVLTVFADQAAAAIASSRLLGDVQRSLADLRAAQEKLLKGERLRVMGEMTSGVAHEFNNLLTAILARIQLMGLGQLPTDIREQLALIEKAALDAAEVVRRLQGFTRQQRQGSHQVVDLGEVCSDVVELLRPLWASRRRHGRTPIVVRLVAAHDLLVRGEATELREVLTNLVKNSLEALETGGSITVGAERVGDFARVSVEDDGCGIPEEQIQRLFTPFFTTKGDRGTGLGLCLCQQIVERHAGNLVISSRVGEGTKAEFRLPIASLEPQKRAKEATAARTRTRILVVDDDPDVLSPLCDYLSRSGFDVTGLPGGAEALVELQRVLPDLVLTDVAMPITDGIEVCRRTRLLRPGLPVVLMSGQASGIDPAVVREAGAAALLAKPFTMRQVLDLIAQVTSDPRSEAPTLRS